MESKNQEEELTPSDEWQQSLKSTCNRLSTQYLTLIKSAAYYATEEGKADPRSGGGRMRSADAPTAPLAADLNRSILASQLASENIIAACAQLLSLIRSLRLSLLMMDRDCIRAEEIAQIQEAQRGTMATLQRAVEKEQNLLKLREERLNP